LASWGFNLQTSQALDMRVNYTAVEVAWHISETQNVKVNDDEQIYTSRSLPLV